MSTKQTDSFWSNQQAVVEDFSRLLDEDFTKADELVQSDENFDHVNTFNACYELYGRYVKEFAEQSNDEFTNQTQKHN